MLGSGEGGKVGREGCVVLQGRGKGRKEKKWSDCVGKKRENKKLRRMWKRKRCEVCKRRGGKSEFTA